MEGKVKSNDIDWANEHPTSFYAKRIFENQKKKSKEK
jgi:hypothetical protein